MKASSSARGVGMDNPKAAADARSAAIMILDFDMLVPSV
jgi:hypothetical protein